MLASIRSYDESSQSHCSCEMCALGSGVFVGEKKKKTALSRNECRISQVLGLACWSNIEVFLLQLKQKRKYCQNSYMCVFYPVGGSVYDGQKILTIVGSGSTLQVVCRKVSCHTHPCLSPRVFLGNTFGQWDVVPFSCRWSIRKSAIFSRQWNYLSNCTRLTKRMPVSAFMWCGNKCSVRRRFGLVIISVK